MAEFDCSQVDLTDEEFLEGFIATKPLEGDDLDTIKPSSCPSLFLSTKATHLRQVLSWINEEDTPGSCHQKVFCLFLES